MASSHAFTLLDPEKWDEVRERNRAGYKRRYGVEPPVQPKVAEESPEIALYVGEEFLATERGQSGGVRYRSHAALARDLLGAW